MEERLNNLKISNCSHDRDLPKTNYSMASDLEKEEAKNNIQEEGFSVFDIEEISNEILNIE